MILPVLLRHPEVEEGTIARAKQYAIKAYEFVVDVEDDAKLFIEQGAQLVKEDFKQVEQKVEETVQSTETEKPKKAAASKDKTAE